MDAVEGAGIVESRNYISQRPGGAVVIRQTGRAGELLGWGATQQDVEGSVGGIVDDFRRKQGQAAPGAFERQAGGTPATNLKGVEQGGIAGPAHKIVVEGNEGTQGQSQPYPGSAPNRVAGGEPIVQ